ncbi:transposase [Geomonas nitrogeniifigens]|uniref:Transposase n=1 Tax=Geomonas diazotrophica TaxID=2843197 RepID=A0ABX8JP45_9BACT|nr:transposase [Geomonas nitrogeniifigens]QWV97200.1 transposase [Geomonas nitrogeniifigens]QXE86373.1 transposase [Geomonas nitrogeniifigens]
MPRQARIDAPGACHHIICRGIERRKIFLDDSDRDRFLLRLGQVLKKSSTRCFAWALIPNHFHLLLQTGNTPISDVMRRLTTGYAVEFNHRHNRSGHLFQNRYKSILCQIDPYLLELVRYIHLNPIRAGIICTVPELRLYRFCGHGQLLGDKKYPWQETSEVLDRFGSNEQEARSNYENFIRDGLQSGHRPDLIGGGLVRSAGGWEEVVAARRAGIFLKSDERILGDSDFVERVLQRAEEHVERITANRAEGFDFEQAVERVARLLKMEVAQIWQHGKEPLLVKARSLLCYWATFELGMTETEVATRLGITQSSVSRSAVRGAGLAAANGWQLRS